MDPETSLNIWHIQSKTKIFLAFLLYFYKHLYYYNLSIFA